MKSESDALVPSPVAISPWYPIMSADNNNPPVTGVAIAAIAGARKGKS